MLDGLLCQSRPTRSNQRVVKTLWVSNTRFDFALDGLDKVENFLYLDTSMFHHYPHFPVFPKIEHDAVDTLRGCQSLKTLVIRGNLTHRATKQTSQDSGRHAPPQDAKVHGFCPGVLVDRPSNDSELVFCTSHIISHNSSGKINSADVLLGFV